MTNAPDSVYPTLARILGRGGKIDQFTPNAEELSLAESHCRGVEPRIFFLTLLKTFQRVGYFLRLADVPRAVAEHVSLLYGVNYEAVGWASYDASGTRKRHVAVIREYLDVRPCDARARESLVDLFREVAETREEIDDFVDAAVEHLVRNRYELPAYGTLCEQARKIRAEVNRRFLSGIRQALGPERCRKIDDLLIDEAGNGPFKLWNRVKTDSGAPTLPTLRELIARLGWLRSLDLHHARFFEGVPATKMARFADEGRSLDASRMWSLADDRRATVGAAMVRHQISQALDDLGMFIVRRVRRMHGRARQALRDFLWEQQAETDRLIQTLHTILETWRDRPEEVEPLIAPELERNLSACQVHLAHSRRNHLPFLWQFHAPQRRALLEVVTALGISSTLPGDSLEQVREFVLAHRNAKRTHVAPVMSNGKPLPLDWIPERWWKFVTGETRRTGTVALVDRQGLEMAFFTHLAMALQNGDAAIPGSDEFSDYREQLVSVEAFPALSVGYCDRTGIERDGAAFVARLRRELAETAERVDLDFPDNSEVRIEDGFPVLARAEAEALPEDFHRIERLLSDALPNHGILDILADVQQWTRFDAGFGLASGAQPRVRDAGRRALYSVFSYGLNLGPTQAARSLPGTDRKSISAYNREHVTLEKLIEANRLVVDAYARLPIIRLWGDGKAAAADGTKREVYDRNLISEYHLRYGGKGAIEYFHVSDTYAALFSHFIPCSVREATYILDGLVRNESVIQPDTLHSDTHGQTAAAFGIACLLGIRLMPRIKNWKDLEFCRPEPAAWYNHIDRLFRATADWDLIAAEYDAMLRVVISIQAGKLLPSTILRRLGPSARTNRLAQAVRELGRVVRTIFLLDYIDDADLRTVIHATTNKAERFNQFKQFLTFGGEGLMTTNDRYELKKRTEYARLVSNCVMLHTASQLTEAIRKLRRKDIRISDAAVSHLSPFQTEHINRFGRYELRKNRLSPPAELRSKPSQGS